MKYQVLDTGRLPLSQKAQFLSNRAGFMIFMTFTIFKISKVGFV